jgi:hypothetical protein
LPMGVRNSGHEPVINAKHFFTSRKWRWGGIFNFYRFAFPHHLMHGLWAPFQYLRLFITLLFISRHRASRFQPKSTGTVKYAEGLLYAFGGPSNCKLSLPLPRPKGDQYLPGSSSDQPPDRECCGDSLYSCNQCCLTRNGSNKNIWHFLDSSLPVS